MEDELKAIKEFTKSIDNVADKLERLNTLFEHYMYNIHGVRSPDVKQDVESKTEH